MLTKNITFEHTTISDEQKVSFNWNQERISKDIAKVNIYYANPYVLRYKRNIQGPML
jgi:hypothetical protein